MPWSVQTWLSAARATEDDPAHSVALAHDLADFARLLAPMVARATWLRTRVDLTAWR